MIWLIMFLNHFSYHLFDGCLPWAECHLKYVVGAGRWAGDEWKQNTNYNILEWFTMIFNVFSCFNVCSVMYKFGEIWNSNWLVFLPTPFSCLDLYVLLSLCILILYFDKDWNDLIKKIPSISNVFLLLLTRRFPIKDSTVASVSTICCEIKYQDYFSLFPLYYFGYGGVKLNAEKTSLVAEWWISNRKRTGQHSS